MPRSLKQLSFLVLLGPAVAGCNSSAEGLGARLDADDPGELPPTELNCKRGPVPDVHVEFGCGCVTVWSCKDLSNVVLQGASGNRERFEGLSGERGVFCADDGGPLTTVWVKSGRNHSGDGPGYGERFDAPDGTCGDAGAGPPPPKDPPTKDPRASDDAGAPTPPDPGARDAGADPPKNPDKPILY